MRAFSPGGTYSESLDSGSRGTQGRDSGPSSPSMLKSSSTAVFWLSFSSSGENAVSSSSGGGGDSRRRFAVLPGPDATLVDDSASRDSSSSSSSSPSPPRTVLWSTASGGARALPFLLFLPFSAGVPLLRREACADARGRPATGAAAEALRADARVLACAIRSGGASLAARAAAEAVLRCLGGSVARSKDGAEEDAARVVLVRDLARGAAPAAASLPVSELVRARVARAGSFFCSSWCAPRCASGWSHDGWDEGRAMY